MISLNNVTKSYKVNNEETKNLFRLLNRKKVDKTVINSITFNIKPGEIVGYIGENGAGKSTTIKMLLGIISKDLGEIKVFGNDPFKARRKNAENIGVLLGQKSQLWWDLPLRDSFSFLQAIYGCNNTEGDSWLNWLIDELNVTEFLKQPVRELSLGQRMRGEFICSLLHQPKLVILDEPTVGLDVQTKKIMMEMILKIRTQLQTTFLITSHDIADIEKICQRVIILDKGSILYDGDIQSYKQIFENYKKIVLYGESIAIKENKYFIKFTTNSESIEYIYDSRYVKHTDMINEIANEAILKRFEVVDLTLSEILIVKNWKVN